MSARSADHHAAGARRLGRGAAGADRRREVTRTDEHGLAHIELTLSPYTTFEVVLHTGDRPDLSPRNPPRVFTVPDSERIFVFDQRFARAEIEAAPVRRRHRRAVRLPQRIPSAPRWGTR